MYKKFLCCLLAVALMLVSGGARLILSVDADSISGTDAGSLGTITTMNDFADDCVMVVLTHEASLQFIDYTPADFPELECAEIDDLSSAKGAKVQAVLRGDQLEMNTIGARFMNQNIDVEGFRRILCLKLANPGKGNVLRAVMALEQREDVYFAEPNYVVQPMAVVLPDMPSTDYAWGADKIQLDDAWDFVTNESSVLVGVVDSGIDVNHPDLNGRVSTSLSKNFTGDSKSATYDGLGHGTHVAGIIGARGVADNFVKGVCQNVTLVSLRVLSDEPATPTYYSTIADAIDYAEEKGIPILNLSLDATGAGLTRLQEAIFRFSGLLICSIGNTGINVENGSGSEPAVWDYDHIISVGASTASDTRESNSNYGRTKTDLFAPGENIVSCYPANRCSSSNCTAAGHISYRYHAISGTSQAAPFVTGVAALILSSHPNVSRVTVKNAILNSVDSVSAFSNICVSGGRLNAYNAICYSALHHNSAYYDAYNSSKHWKYCNRCNYSVLENHIMDASGQCYLCYYPNNT